MNLKRFLAVIAALCVLAAPAVAFAATATQDSNAGGTKATAQEARQAASNFTVGQPMGPVEGVTARTIEVREVLAQL